jgi:hypothetical protein
MSETTVHVNGTTAGEPPQTTALIVPDTDLGEPLETAVEKAVTAQLDAQAKKVATGVIEQMLTPEVLAGMREKAIHEAELIVAGQAPAEEERELRYKTVLQFVDEYVSVLYRRKVARQEADSGLRWCPSWWQHGEVLGRFRALWRAFESLRIGESVEPAQWWIQYFDPMMDRILDPEGPFRYCTLEAGHNARLAKLPTTVPPPGLFEEEAEEAHGETGAAASHSGIIVPQPAPRRRLIRQFP